MKLDRLCENVDDLTIENCSFDDLSNITNVTHEINIDNCYKTDTFDKMPHNLNSNIN